MDLRRNCLVIDDDKIALKLAASCCHELGLKVYVADTPTEAVDELKRRRYEYGRCLVYHLDAIRAIFLPDCFCINSGLLIHKYC